MLCHKAPEHAWGTDSFLGFCRLRKLVNTLMCTAFVSGGAKEGESQRLDRACSRWVNIWACSALLNFRRFLEEEIFSRKRKGAFFWEGKIQSMHCGTLVRYKRLFWTWFACDMQCYGSGHQPSALAPRRVGENLVKVKWDLWQRDPLCKLVRTSCLKPVAAGARWSSLSFLLFTFIHFPFWSYPCSRIWLSGHVAHGLTLRYTDNLGSAALKVFQ